jgi:hypothetical protein
VAVSVPAARLRGLPLPAVGAAPLAVSALVAGVVAAAVLAGGGVGDGPVAWLGAVTAVAAALGATALLLGGGRWPGVGRSGGLAMAALAAFVAWNGVTILWSADPARSWAYFDRGVASLGFVCLGLALAVAVPRAPTVLSAMGVGTVAACAAWALAAKIAPGLHEDYGRIARLVGPVGFWNALAAVLAIGVPLALWLATGRHRPSLRAAGVVVAYLVTVAMALTLSRAGILLGAIALVVWLVRATPRYAAVASGLLAVVPGAAVGAWALGLAGVADDGVDFGIRVADGRAFGLVLAAVGAWTGVIAYLAARVDARSALVQRRVRSLDVAATAALGVVAVALAAGLVVQGGNPFTWAAEKVRELARSEYIDSSTGRLPSFSLNSRVDWWEESLHGFADSPIGGTGAGTFAYTHLRYREIKGQFVTEPHNLPLQALSETGVVGLALLGLACAFGVRALRRARRGLPEGERAAGLALAIGLAVWALHGLVDIDWDFVAVNAIPLVALGVLLGSESTPRAARPLPRLVLVPWLAAAVLCVALLAPWLSAQRVREASAAFSQGDLPRSLSLARSAQSANPVALEPLLARADAAIALGDAAQAEAALLTAVDRQEENPRAWLAIGRYELEAGRPERAAPLLERAWQLDPLGPLDPNTESESELELARRLAGLPPLASP